MGVAYNPKMVTSGLVCLVDIANPKSYSGSGTIVTDIIRGNNFTVVGSPTYNSNGYFSFGTDQTSQYLVNTAFPMPTDDHTISCWFRATFVSGDQCPYGYTNTGNNALVLLLRSGGGFLPLTLDSQTTVSTTSMSGVWINFTRTRVKSSGLCKWYRDGVHLSSSTIQAGTSVGTNGIFVVGQDPDSGTPPYGFDSTQNLDGDFAQLSVYDRALTDDEVLQNFNANKGRFGF